jgi:RNase H-like domain found in reverse transcriptase
MSRPTMKKVEAIMKMDRPKIRKQLRSFIDMVNYYRLIRPQRSHLSAPLYFFTLENARWNWTTECQNAFDGMRTLIAKETWLTYPYFKKPFEIHTDATKVHFVCIS